MDDIIQGFWMVLGKPAKIWVVALLLGALLVGFQAPAAKADVPNVVSLAYRNVGSVTWLDMAVRHGGAISSFHYVSSVQLEINGTSQNLPQTPQSAETFTVSFNLGSSSNKYSVRARALCNLHDYSAWSSPIVVPEFSVFAMILFIALLTSVIAAGKKTVNSHKSIRNLEN
jgi:hypothetical protein